MNYVYYFNNSIRGYISDLKWADWTFCTNPNLNLIFPKPSVLVKIPVQFTKLHLFRFALAGNH